MLSRDFFFPASLSVSLFAASLLSASLPVSLCLPVCFPLCQSRMKTALSKPSISWFCFCVPARPSRNATIAPRCLLSLTFPDLIWHRNKTKQEAWLLWAWFGIAEANKLVSLAWFLHVLISFRRFTLHYNNSYFENRSWSQKITVVRYNARSWHQVICNQQQP